MIIYFYCFSSIYTTSQVKRSIIVDILDFLADLILLLQIFLEVLHLLAQQFIHLQFLLDDAFQFLDIGVDIIVHESDALDGGDEFALLCE